jgi:hypothetical protein
MVRNGTVQPESTERQDSEKGWKGGGYVGLHEMQAPGQRALGSYALGDLPTCHAATVEKHLARCADCRVSLRQMEQLVIALRMLPLTTAPRRQCPA